MGLSRLARSTNTWLEKYIHTYNTTHHVQNIRYKVESIDPQR